jgi:hypothetical protein
VLVASAAVLLTGCGTDRVTPASSRDSLAPPASAQPPAPAAAPKAAAPRDSAPAATGRPANALSWNQPAVSDEDLDRSARVAWAAAHGLPVQKVVGEQLLMGLADRGELMVGVYQLWVPGGRAHVVVAQSEPRSEAVIVQDRVASPGLPVVAGVVSRRTAEVVASVAPGTTRVEYRAHASAVWRVVDQDSLDLVFARSGSHGPGEALRTTRAGKQAVTPLSPPESAAPANVVAWPARGAASRGPSTAVVAAAYAKAMGAPSAQVKRLFSGDTDSGVRYLVGQAWVPGKPAQTVSYVVHPTRGGELQMQPVTPRGTRVIAALITDLPGTTTNLLVVVPEPRTTQVSYRASGHASWKPGYTDAMLDGVNLIDRSKAPADDSLQVMTGNGDPNAASTLVVRVSRVLCSGPSCS